MVIDIHRHLWSIDERFGVRVPGAAPSRHTPAERRERLLSGLESRAAQILAEMNAADVSRSVIFFADYELRLGEEALSIEEANRAHADLARRSNGRLVAFFGIDPRRPSAASLFATALEEWGIRGLKLHPTTGFSPSDAVCEPLYELARTHRVPVVIHTGPMASPLLSDFARPMQIDAAAANFQDVSFVMQHAGQDLWPEALGIAFWKPNVFLELSMWQWVYRRDPAEFVRAVGRMIRTIGADRILFGSDFPGLRHELPLGDWVAVFRRLPDLARAHGFEITVDEVHAILGGNAKRLLGSNRPK